MIRGIIVFLGGVVAGAAMIIGFAPELHLPVAIATAIHPAPEAKATDTPPPPPTGIGALGHIQPRSFVRYVSPPGMMAMNRVDRLLVHEGDHVTQGQLLAEFADATLKDATVTEAEAALATAKADLARVKAGGRPTDIAAQKERIASLQAQSDIARKDAGRAATLVPSGAGAVAAADRTAAVAKRLEAQELEAVAQLMSLETPRPEDVELAQKRVQAAEATLIKVRADAALSRVYAPVAGQVLKIYARLGDTVGHDGLLAMADLSALDVVADVYQTDVPRIRIGDRADIIVPGSQQHYGATVRKIGWMVRHGIEAGVDPTAAVDARTVEVTFALDQDGAEQMAHRIGMQVQVAMTASVRVARE